LNLGGGGSGGASNAFTIMQPISGTAPTASSATDTLTFTSSDSSISVAGNSGTKTLDFTIPSTIPGARTFSGALTFSAGGTITLSGGTSTTFARSGPKAGIRLMDSDTYLTVPGIDFLAGAAGTTLVGEWDASQFIISTRMEFFADATYDIGQTYRPRNIRASGTITAANYMLMQGPIVTGVNYITSGSNTTLPANTHLVILDPASPTASQTITMPTTGNSVDGLVVVISVGAQGVTALTVNANTGQTIVGGGALGTVTATSIGWVYRSTVWHRYF
jgi:hypothetical protein